MLIHLSESLKHNLGIILPTDSATNFIKKLACILVERPCLLKYHLIQCKFHEILKLYNDIKKILDLAQQGVTQEGRLKLNNLKIDIKIMDLPYTASEKGEIAEQFSYNFLQTDKNDSIITLEQEIKDLKYKLALPPNFESLEALFNDSILNIVPKEFDPNFLPVSSGFTNDISLNKFRKQQEKILQEKE